MTEQRYTNLEIDLKVDSSMLRLEKKFDLLVHRMEESFLALDAKIDKEIGRLDLNLRWMQIIGAALFTVMMSLLGIMLSKLH